MALSADRDVKFYPTGELIDLPVADNVRIYKGAFVGRDRATGYARPLVAGDDLLGIAYRGADNTVAGHTAGGISVRLQQAIDIVHALTGVTVADLGKPVFASADDALTLTPTGNSRVGRVVAVEATSLARIRPFFSAAHAEGDSGAQSNSLTHDVGTTSAPTDEEMHGAMVKAIGQILSFADDQGEPMNEAARSFLVMVPMPFLSSTLTALASRMVDASSNPLATGAPFRVQWVANPRLTWTTKFAVFRTDGSTRPFIFQEELPVQVQVLAEGSELEVNENQHQYGVKAVHEAGFGFWQDACLVNFT